jgi:hypothetical protein
MRDQPMDTPETNSRKPSTAPLSITTRQYSPVFLPSNQLDGEMSLLVLVAHCTRELESYRRGEPIIEEYGVELIRRAIGRDQEARACVQRCFSGIVLDWIHHHPSRAAACRLKSKEHYMAQAFEHFWQATTSYQQVECTTLAGVLHSLRVCLQGAMLDALRVAEQLGETSFPETGEAREPSMDDVTSSSKAWEMLESMLGDRREHRLAYLLFHCGLKPQEIVRFYPQEWSDVHEISRLRHIIIQRLLNHAHLS